MLTTLSIKDFVLIDQLTLELDSGLTVLTGETGAGKSILLDAIGLALGLRASQGLVRQGARQASVSVAFQLPKRHPVYHELRELDLPVPDDELILRRTFQDGGRSRVYINDVPTSVNALKRLGPALIEIQGQFDVHGLLDQATHRQILVDFCRCGAEDARMNADWHAWKQAERALAQAQEDIQRGQREEDYLRFSVNELEQLNPSEGEENDLSNRRQMLMNLEAVREASEDAMSLLADPDAGAETHILRALGTLDRLSAKVGDSLSDVIEALGSASAELSTAIGALNQLSFEGDVNELAGVDERLFALRDCARKHGVSVDDLPEVLARQQRALQSIDNQSDHLDKLEKDVSKAADQWRASATALVKTLSTGAHRLDKIVNDELPKLRLENAKFVTNILPLPEHQFSELGTVSIGFEATTNPGVPPGPINKVASGGELSRFLLALKVALANDNPLPTLVFDEVDSGVGGATAAAVGDRLQQLARNVQVLCITHSPQVAAKGRQHLHVSKGVQRGLTTTSVSSLSATQRQQEIARMLAGADVSDSALAAAKDLLQE